MPERRQDYPALREMFNALRNVTVAAGKKALLPERARVSSIVG